MTLIGYDAHQLGSVLTLCFVCRRWFYMTKPNERCIRCRQRHGQ